MSTSRQFRPATQNRQIFLVGKDAVGLTPRGFLAKIQVDEQREVRQHRGQLVQPPQRLAGLLQQGLQVVEGDAGDGRQQCDGMNARTSSSNVF